MVTCEKKLTPCSFILSKYRVLKGIYVFERKYAQTGINANVCEENFLNFFILKRNYPPRVCIPHYEQSSSK